MAAELAQAVESINQEASLLAAVLTGSGPTFSTGWEGFDLASADKLAEYQAAAHLARIQIPVVAAINGDAMGQGLELALAADLRIAAGTARFAMPQLRCGVLPWDGGTQRLPRIVGRAHAADLLLTGRTIDAAEALAMGLVGWVVLPDDLPAAVDRVVSSIVACAPVAVRYAKEAIAAGAEMTLDQGLHLEADLNILLHSTRDRREGIESFLRRRSPSFTGE